jgi:ketopantoate reductase
MFTSGRTTMRIAMMGSGGIGGYFGARLAAAGENVAFIERGTHLDELRQNGLRLQRLFALPRPRSLRCWSGANPSMRTQPRFN